MENGLIIEVTDRSDVIEFKGDSATECCDCKECECCPSIAPAATSQS